MSFTIVSWNMQGGSFQTDVGKATHLKSFMESGYDCICIQEATEPLPSFSKYIGESPAGNIQVFTTPSPRMPLNSYYCYFASWGIGNSRCSMAVYTKRETLNYHLEAYSNEARPMLVVNLGCCIVGNVHLTSNNQTEALREFKHYQYRMMQCSRKLPSFIVGDFNMDWDFISGHFLEKEQTKFHHANVPTYQSNNMLDYVYCGNPDINIKMHVSNKLYSDHFSILAVIK